MFPAILPVFLVCSARIGAIVTLFTAILPIRPNIIYIFYPDFCILFCHMRIVYKDGVAYKVDAFGRLVPSKTKPFGTGLFRGAPTIVMRVPKALVPAVRALIVQSLDADTTDYSHYTTPGYEDAEVIND